MAGRDLARIRRASLSGQVARNDTAERREEDVEDAEAKWRIKAGRLKAAAEVREGWVG